MSETEGHYQTKAQQGYGFMMTELEELKAELMQDEEFRGEYEEVLGSALFDGSGFAKASINPETGKPSFKEIKLQEFYKDL